MSPFNVSSPSRLLFLKYRNDRIEDFAKLNDAAVDGLVPYRKYIARIKIEKCEQSISSFSLVGGSDSVMVSNLFVSAAIM